MGFARREHHQVWQRLCRECAVRDIKRSRTRISRPRRSRPEVCLRIRRGVCELLCRNRGRWQDWRQCLSACDEWPQGQAVGHVRGVLRLDRVCRHGREFMRRLSRVRIRCQSSWCAGQDLLWQRRRLSLRTRGTFAEHELQLSALRLQQCRDRHGLRGKRHVHNDQRSASRLVGLQVGGDRRFVDRSDSCPWNRQLLLQLRRRRYWHPACLHKRNGQHWLQEQVQRRRRKVLLPAPAGESASVRRRCRHDLRLGERLGTGPLCR